MMLNFDGQIYFHGGLVAETAIARLLHGMAQVFGQVIKQKPDIRRGFVIFPSRPFEDDIS